jgi:hypothetical protein
MKRVLKKSCDKQQPSQKKKSLEFLAAVKEKVSEEEWAKIGICLFEIVTFSLFYLQI